MPFDGPRPDTRWFHVVVSSEKGEVPFFLALIGDPDAGAEAAVVANGDERIGATVRRRGRELKIEFSIFGTWLELDERVDGTLVGARVVPHGGYPREPVAGVPIERPDPFLRFRLPPERPARCFDFSGSWRVDFAAAGPGVATLRQDERGVVVGTFVLASFGDLRYLAGRADGDRLRLSTFDGQHAYVIDAERGEAGDRMRGEWIDIDGFVEDGHFTAVRDPDAETVVFDRGPLGRVGGTISLPGLDDPSLAGKPVIVDLFGTWCPGCMDATPFLVELYRENHARGLELLGVAYELRSPAENRTHVDRFIAHYQIPWQVKVVDVPAGDMASVLPPELKDVEAWPTAIFLDRDHKVRAIHTGFAGPATGARHERLKADWRRLVTSLLR